MQVSFRYLFLLFHKLKHLASYIIILSRFFIIQLVEIFQLNDCRYSLPLIFYALCILFLALMRIPTCLCIFRKEWHRSGSSTAVYAALYFYPLLILAHSLCAGVMCMFQIHLYIPMFDFINFVQFFIDYFFPYIVALACLVVNGFYLSTTEDQVS